MKLTDFVRDMKPENILLDSVGEDACIKVIDFGISRRFQKGKGQLMT